LEMKTGFKKKTEQNRKTGLPPKPMWSTVLRLYSHSDILYYLEMCIVQALGAYI
jgi:hypothetical protein